MEEGQRIELCRAHLERGTVFETVGHHCRLPSLVVPIGFEPISRPNLGLTVYKTVVLPLNYRTIKNWYSAKDSNLDNSLIGRGRYRYASGI